ncbi:MAG: PepSY-associated TM helix domain-containing protein [Proteobacteria bacterium]|nr:hypothetical protein [Desulfobulbaceae bacterium]MBU4154190.1 PepSY-associated TM helix domain-containing protein [Pseudomonadota bacterium]MDP2106115.1 PepSY-associated TM helix domain-containing protein [Desulfobulbaceae bacterium]
MTSRAFRSAPLLHALHRIGGLITATFILCYSLTGIVLNHRQAFDYFQTSQIAQFSAPKADLGAINEFIGHYREQIGRPDAPEVIRIKNGATIELLYGSHGQTTYTIDPAAGTMKVETKSPNQPLYFLNKLHKAAKTHAAWLWLSDALALCLIVSTVSVLFIMRFRTSDYCLLLAGIGLCLAGGMIA